MTHETQRAELRAAAEDYRRLQAARERLTQAVRAANTAGMRQVDILSETGHVWTREQVRRICLPSKTESTTPE
jgi:hypothetical protein